MSTKYKISAEVPTAALAKRLDELSDVVGQPGEERDRELTQRIPAELDRDADLVLCEAAQRLVKLETERDALAAHVCQLTSIAEKVCTISPEYLDHLASDAAFVLKTTPTTSLARCDALKQAEAMRHVAKWLSGEIEEGCIGLDLGGEISGPTGCSDADKCRVAGERIFREAARIWECRFVLEDQQ